MIEKKTVPHMKPKYNNILRHLQLSAFIAASLPFTAQAAIINDDSEGNVNLNISSGASTIRADGGTDVASPEVNIGGSVSLTGDAGETEVLEITAANYTVTNAGTLAGTAHDGIFSTFAFTLNNTGTISAAGANSGVQTLGGSSITNSSSITGTDDAIRFTTNGGTVTNNVGGTISGITGASSDGIEGLDSVTVTNFATISGSQQGIDVLASLLLNNYGSITGGSDGVSVTSGATINNNTTFSVSNPFPAIAGGQITGNGGNGITATSGLSFVNQALGLVQGSTNGINATSGATITNDYQIIGLGGNGVTATTDLTLTNNGTSGLIRGSANGIVATDGGAITTNITNSDEITGLAGDGVRALDSFVLINNAGGVITGTGGTGVWLDDNASVTNNGTITGTNSGVRVSEGSTVTNTGTISGSIGIDAFGSGSTFNLTNSGTITGTGGTAIDGILGGGVDTYLLNAGSLVTGDIFLRSGDDTITQTSDSDDSSIVDGNIDGGSGTDTLNFYEGKVEDGGSENYVDGNITSMENINKYADGTAFVFGTVNSDTVRVFNNGGLYILGNVDGAANAFSDIQINDSAAIGGTGTWDAAIILRDDSSISAGDTPQEIAADVEDAVGTLNLVGNLTFNNNSFIRFDMNPQNDGQDLINHSGGTVTFNSNEYVRLSPTNINQVISDGTYTIINSNAAIVGIPDGVSVLFNSNATDSGPYSGSLVPDLNDGETQNEYDTNLGSFTTLALQNGNTDLVAIVDHDYEGLLGVTPNMAAFGAAIDNLTNDGDSDVQDFIAALDYSDEATALATAAALSPENQISKSVALLNSNYHKNRILVNHLARGRNDSSNGNTVRQPVGSKASDTLARMSNNSTVWGTLSHNLQDYEDSTNNIDYDGSATSFTAGIDWSVTSSLILGMMIDGSTGDYDYTGGSSDTESMSIAAYGTWGEATGLYSDFAVGYGNQSMDDSRNFGGIFGGGTNSSTDANSLQALVTLGYTFQKGAIKHGPFVGIEYQDMDVDGFSVNNSAIPLTVGDYDVESIRALIGYRAEATYGKFNPYASIAYAHEFNDDDVIANAALAGSPFAVTTDGPGSAILIGLGTGYTINQSLSANIGYQGEIATDSEGIVSHGFNLGLDWAF